MDGAAMTQVIELLAKIEGSAKVCAVCIALICIAAIFAIFVAQD